ncbi:hypothetical protein [Variovorax sp. WS11]|uniref:hypothetical protein n=1 Tax=Variovorax sp. WS11 TaxID=1105204 RepID=UPI0011B24F17|nr:hypothetical protein [Variovorax sp. WS11]NDZ12401.1 hypothetical protein [Variovorax sp. WS11]
MVAENTKPVLSDVIVVGAELPTKVLARPFEKYLFFDADISSSGPMISAVRDVVVACFGLDVEVEIFASSNRISLARLEKGMDWPVEIFRLGRAIRESGDTGGLTLVDTKRRWVAYQSRPVDTGIFAIDCHAELDGIQAMKDSFFDCANISIWLSRRTLRDADLVQSFGTEFLAMLIRNYS